MDEITKIETIDQYDQLFGLETLHPLVNVIDFSKATKTVEYYHMNIGFYSLFLKDINCGDLKYGRNYYDYQEGTVVCMAPGQVIGIDNRKKTPQRTKSIGVLFHPDLIRGTSLGQNIKNYSFFSYEVNEALHLSEQEKQIILNCTNNLQKELSRDIDKFSLRLIAVHLELLMDYCLRFYERQFITRTNINQDILAHFNRCLEKYFQSERPEKTELRAIEFAREEIPQSLAYLNDLIRSESGKTLREYTRFKRIEMTKELIRTSDKTLPEIATGLGFTDSRTLFCLFKKIVGSTPEEYKKKWGYPSNELPS